MYGIGKLPKGVDAVPLNTVARKPARSNLDVALLSGGRRSSTNPPAGARMTRGEEDRTQKSLLALLPRTLRGRRLPAGRNRGAVGGVYRVGPPVASRMSRSRFVFPDRSQSPCLAVVHFFSSSGRGGSPASS
ncbi:hypothetical protein HPB50_004692 [Hyalomma asiaticum]|uniref:Uncharacterized protein n=1 Tax=Hyalomma asiaticum TaxID=266040 RepID=A0ACB7SXI1_HYAAI|nr:hypothetical protein HPB50_004692 [Hyalomma asiaticum]